MCLTKGDQILIKNLYLLKIYSAIRLIKEFLTSAGRRWHWMNFQSNWETLVWQSMKPVAVGKEQHAPITLHFITLELFRVRTITMSTSLR